VRNQSLTGAEEQLNFATAQTGKRIGQTSVSIRSPMPYHSFLPRAAGSAEVIWVYGRAWTPPEEATCATIVPFGDSCAYSRAGNADPFDREPLQGIYLKTYDATKPSQGTYVPAASRTKVKVVAKQQRADPESLDKNIKNERFRRHTCNHFGERADI